MELLERIIAVTIEQGTCISIVHQDLDRSCVDDVFDIMRCDPGLGGSHTSPLHNVAMGGSLSMSGSTLASRLIPVVDRLCLRGRDGEHGAERAPDRSPCDCCGGAEGLQLSPPEVMTLCLPTLEKGMDSSSGHIASCRAL